MVSFPFYILVDTARLSSSLYLTLGRGVQGLQGREFSLRVMSPAQKTFGSWETAPDEYGAVTSLHGDLRHIVSLRAITATNIR